MLLFLGLTSGWTESPDDDLLRTFTYKYQSPFSSEPQPPVEIHIRDGRYGGDIGSQTWNSAPLLSKKLCAAPWDFFAPMVSPEPSSKAHEQNNSISPLMPATPPPTRPVSPTPQQPFRILELGSGTGLTGLAAGLVLARLIKEARAMRPDLVLRPVQLILTDYLKPVLDNLSHNLSLNAQQLEVEGLDVSVELLDWRDVKGSNVHGQFDLILGTDLVYEVQHAGWAASVVDHYLSWPASNPSKSKLTNTLLPPTPADSRAPSPAPFDTSVESVYEPKFHLVLALRPTFRAESTAVHTAFNSSFGLPTNQDSSMPLPERKYMPSSEGPALDANHGETSGVEGRHNRHRLVTRACDTLIGISHGQGCGDYQYLIITRD